MNADLWFTARGDEGASKWSRFSKYVITFLKFGLHTKFPHVMVEVGEKDGYAQLVSAEMKRGVRIVSAEHYIKGPYHVSVRRNNGLTVGERRCVAKSATYLVGQDYAWGPTLGQLLGYRFAGWLANRTYGKKNCSWAAGFAYWTAPVRNLFYKRHSGKLLEPGQLRPRDIEWSTRNEVDSSWQEIYSLEPVGE